MEKLRILLCENFRLEIEKLQMLNHFVDVEFIFIPSKCEFPREHENQLFHFLPKNSQQGETPIFTVGTPTCFESKHISGYVGEIPGQKFTNCHQFVCESSVVDVGLAKHLYLITPSWLSQWRQRIAHWGMDSATATLFFAEFCAGVLVLDTGVFEHVTEEAKKLAEFINQPVEITEIGLKPMIHNLEKIVLQAKHSVELAAVKNQLFESEQQKSDFALIKETLFLLAKRNKVADLIADCLNMCRMLFAPERVTFTFCNAETAQKFSVNLENQNVQDIEFYKENLKNGTKNWCLTKGEDGFAMRVSIRNQNCGILIVERVQFVEKLHHYLNLGLHIVNVFGLTMDTISQYERVEESEQQLQIDKQKLEKALQDIKTLRGLIPICSYCKSIRDDSGFWNQLEKYIINNSEAELSHGICPDCAEKICPELDMDKYRISEDPLEYTI